MDNDDTRTEHEILEAGQTLLPLARALCASSEDARDLLQTTFEKSLRHRRSYRAGTNARAWMSTILRRQAIEQVRRHGSWLRCRRRYQHELDCLQPSADEDQPSQARFSLADVQRAAGRLSPLRRQVFQLRTLEHLSNQEIARKLGMKPVTVATLLHKARKDIRRHCLAQAPQEEIED